MNNESVELTGYLIIVIAILLYIIGWFLKFEEPVTYNAICVPAVVVILSFIALQLKVPETDGRTLLKFLIGCAIIIPAIYFIGYGLLRYYFSGWGRTT